MANWDFVFVYDDRFADWLTKQGYPHPPVLPDNRMPSTVDMKAVLIGEGGLVLDYPDGYEAFYVYEQGANGFTVCIDGFDWSDDEFIPAEYFRIRWMGELQASLLTALSRRCGQLYFYPESGAAGVIFPTRLSPPVLAALYTLAEKKEDPWRFLFEQLYSQLPER